MEIKCDENQEGMRLDRFLRKYFKNESLGKIFEGIRIGTVRINGKKSKENYRLRLNDIVSVNFSGITDEKKTKRLDIDKKKYMNMILYENKNYLIINKPGGIAVHKGTANEYGLAEIYKYIFSNNDINFANRIDKETAGLLVAAKNLKSLRYLTEKIREKQLIKKYAVLVHGKVKEEYFEIENYLEVKESKTVVSDSRTGKLSKTKYKRIKFIDGNYTLLEVDLITGRKHQIRIQLSDYGHPIVGDVKYGIKDKSKKLMLVSYFLEFDKYKFQIDYNEYMKI